MFNLFLTGRFGSRIEPPASIRTFFSPALFSCSPIQAYVLAPTSDYDSTLTNDSTWFTTIFRHKQSVCQVSLPVWRNCTTAHDHEPFPFGRTSHPRNPKDTIRTSFAFSNRRIASFSIVWFVGCSFFYWLFFDRLHGVHVWYFSRICNNVCHVSQ